MNSLPPLSLPRFHVNELSRPHKAKNASVQTHVPEQDFEAVQEEIAAVPEPEQEAVSAQPELPVAPMLPEIDTGAILNSLETAKVDLERAALAHSQHLVSEFLQAAFPALCEQFLADEVMQALTRMAPNEIEKLVINVPEAFEPSFQRAFQGAPQFNEVFELKVMPDRDDIAIEVDWQTGGLQFDMQQFLESSLVRLSGPNQTQEGHNV